MRVSRHRYGTNGRPCEPQQGYRRSELTGVHPFALDRGPPIEGQAGRYLLVTPPGITLQPPARAPRVTDEERALIGADLLVVVVPDGGDGVAAVELAALLRHRHQPAGRDVHEFVVDGEAEHAREAAR